MSMVMALRNSVSRDGLRRVPAAVGLAVLAVGLWAADAGVAQAQDAGAVMQRMDRLERDLSTLQRQVYRGEAAPGPSSGIAVPTQSGQAQAQPLPGDVAGRLQGRLADLERLIQDLTGRVEQTQFETRRMAQRLDQLVTDVDFRLSRIEQATGLGGMAAAGPADAPSGASPEALPGAPTDAPAVAGTMTPVVPGSPVQPLIGAPSAGQGTLGYMRSDGTAVGAPGQPQRPPPAQGGAPGAAAGVLPEGTAEEQYRAAFSLLRKGDFGAAEQALGAFLERHPDHELAGNAQYWLGESHYVRGDMQQAAVAFLDGYRTYPESGKGPDNLLKLGMTMGQLGQTDQACAALEKLGQDYPQAADAIKRRAVAERQKIGCR